MAPSGQQRWVGAAADHKQLWPFTAALYRNMTHIPQLTRAAKQKVKEHAHRGASGLVLWIRGLLARCVGFGSESTLDSVSRLAK